MSRIGYGCRCNIRCCISPTKEYRRLAALGVEWSRDLDPRNQVLAFGQAGTIRYPDDTTRDVNLLLGGGGWSHRYARLADCWSSTSAYLGDETARESDGDPNGRTYYGLRLGTQWSGIPAHTPYASLSWQHSGYDAVNPVFMRYAQRGFRGTARGLGLATAAALECYGGGQRVDNSANIALYDYTRQQYARGCAVSVRLSERCSVSFAKCVTGRLPCSGYGRWFVCVHAGGGCRHGGGCRSGDRRQRHGAGAASTGERRALAPSLAVLCRRDHPHCGGLRSAAAFRDGALMSLRAEQ